MTAPLRQAPDADEPVPTPPGEPIFYPDRGYGGQPVEVAPDADERIVAVLAEAVCECGHLAMWHSDPTGWPEDVSCGTVDLSGWCACKLPRPQALAPTVARLIEDAVAERLAGVDLDEALGTEVRKVCRPYRGGYAVEVQHLPSVVRNALRSALHIKETQ